ncbi:putative oligomeric golgi complex subunit 2 protein [Eutypa lata UCREL1]|uniref:Conserved oligomeric Golgi complex subunit 2 n=1 Tax=Eutypa lata (strain UCR-EL1) TaxID=1287681 RepID=M7TGK8_EUTLA|nr:putative oligomeric golgi complex subunit 2 protein [Eutypa lata UCREL1]
MAYNTNTTLSLSARRPRGNSRAFALPSSSSSSDTEDDDAPLPFPAALPRTDFLAPDFDAASYLSSLPHRHQTLEDLRSDLRERSAAISAELLELVNANYTSFLSLGSELKGGEDRVEDVRVALLGFRRAVEEIKGRVGERARDVGSLNRELGGVRTEIEVGRKMLELDERVEALEGRLAVGGGKGVASDESDEEEDDDDDSGIEEGMVCSSAAKLAQLAQDYVAVDNFADAVGRDSPFVRKMEERMIRCRNTILLDLSTALKEAKRAGVTGQRKLLKLMGIYTLMDAQTEAVKALKGH